MSCSYADGLSHYENKGVLGVPEQFDSEKKVDEKCEVLAQWIKNSKHIVLHTGAGISTSAGIPDFRGPNGVWTLEKEGKKPNINISFNEAIPTKTHMAIKHLLDKNIIHYVISQNIDGLHLKSGVSRTHMAELHGNMFIGQCNTCESQFVRPEATSTVGKKCLNEDCKRSSMLRGRTCRGKLHDTILDWEDSLPEYDLEMSDYHSSLADLNICLGTTLQIVPSGNLPLRCKKYGGKVAIVNLQPTKHDKKVDLIINSYVDDVISRIMKKLGLEIPDYSTEVDPTKNQLPSSVIEWNILKTNIDEFRDKYDVLVREYKKLRIEQNILNNSKKLAKTVRLRKEKSIKKNSRSRKKKTSKAELNLVNQSNLKIELTKLVDMENMYSA
ncbi:NAD-dependent protein deacetylase Sirt6 [Diabrotica virgifera virgifera]|uniref:protein acetyllysine N-acetyltransferase n=1 Tax=Diabrotica virgifera virgifera TaxID=50390 RepID=A0A6P7G9G6_DIAVI|nr:NAD-dependent protein deacetylase Sirt6 [Diabrotica virgifera virgifera]